eukprot:GHUV01015679.1.p1 GENE.GHUV01015679.1~~GHUV01015679.1.p1  ORF type:complete len:151 (+),score=20.68 GHUV01015679.1:453-905(+)
MAARRLLVASLLLAQGLWLVRSNKDCEKLGFTGLQACSDCDSMAEYVKSEELVSDCRNCCVKDEGSNLKYTSAKLEVCPYRLSGLPHLQDFIEKHASKYKGQLKVVRSIGAYPKLVLTNKQTGNKASVRIDNWKVATIHDYLRDKLVSSK